MLYEKDSTELYKLHWMLK